MMSAISSSSIFSPPTVPSQTPTSLATALEEELLPLTVPVADGFPQPALATDVVDRAQQKAEEAKKLGIDLAKKGFIVKLFGLAVAGAALGTAIAATVLTGGMGVPLVALCGTAFALAASDAGCAFYHWRSKAGGSEGLVMAGDVIANVVYRFAEKCGASEDAAMKWGIGTSIVGRVMLALATLWTGFFQPTNVTGEAAAALGYVRTAAGTVSHIGGLVSGNISVVAAQQEKATMETHEATQQQLQRTVKRLQEELSAQQHKIQQLMAKLSDSPGIAALDEGFGRLPSSTQGSRSMMVFG